MKHFIHFKLIHPLYAQQRDAEYNRNGGSAGAAGVGGWGAEGGVDE